MFHLLNSVTHRAFKHPPKRCVIYNLLTTFYMTLKRIRDIDIFGIFLTSLAAKFLFSGI